MGGRVVFTQEAEQRRVAAVAERRAKKPKFELLITSSVVEAAHFARDNGWFDKKVQVKAYRLHDNEWEYAVEPLEVDCKCPNLLKYSDYFDDPAQVESEG